MKADGLAGPNTFATMGLHELILLRRGSRGDTVRRLQEALGQGADGIFGGGTETAVKAFQTANGLKADGMVGPKTLATIDLFPEITEETVMASLLPADWLPQDGTDGNAGGEMVAEVGASVWSTVSSLFE